MESILRGLNVAQRAAVTSPASILQVLAPPGSGKTKTLTSRVAYLLAHHGYTPWNVICCTFTIKASREMRERLRGMIGGDLESRLLLGTFHSICRRYLVSYGHLIGIPKNFGIADSDDSLNIIKRAVKKLNLSIDPRTARSRISHRKARGKRLDDLPKASKTIEAQEFTTIFREYEEALQTSNLLDYDDLLIRCVELLKSHPECVTNVEALLIDEFQDTNIVQFELMKLLASANKRITIVGDPDQSIYGFRSAEIENLRRMKKYYPDTVVINLEENYRSSSAILKLAQEVIEQDHDRPEKKLKSTHCYGTLPVLRRLPNPNEEARWIVAEIKRITSMTGNLVQHGDIAILLRSAFLSLLIEKALANAGIPYRMVGGRRFFDRVEVRVLLDYLRTISHPDNTSALLAIINTPTRKVGDTTIKELTRIAEINKESLWSTIQKALDGSSPLDKKLSKPAEQGLNDLVSLIKKARQKMETMVPEQTPAKLIEHVIKSLGYQEYLKKQYREDHEERWENVKELLTQASDATLQFNPIEDQLPQIDGVVQEQVEGPQEVLSRFLANVVLSTEKDTEDGETKPRVTISTIHSAKGLEWPVVFVPAIYEGSIPHSRAEDTNEERRLLYVALTRAQALLYMTFPVMQSRDESESILSQFLPSKITHMISQTGPVFNDKVVGDIATITRRPPASQEDLVRGLQSIKEGESQYDDLWPVDGTHRRSHLVDREYPSFYLQPGQSLSDALKPSGQRSNFSTVSYSAATTMTNATSFSTANLSTTFTTAGHHLKNTPQLSEKPKPTLTKSASDTSSMTTKRPPLIKTISSQGSIASFFSNGTTKPKPKSERETLSITPQESDSEAELEVLKERSRPQQQSQPSAQYLSPLPIKSSSSIPSTTTTDKIPPDLLKHRLTNPNLLLKRPRSALDQATSSEINKTKRRNYHHCFSSDPAEEPNDDEEASKNPNTSSSLASSTSTSTSTPSTVNMTSTFPNAKPPQIQSSILHSTTMSSMSNSASTNDLNTNNSNRSHPLTTNPNTRFVGLNTLQGLQRLSGGAAGTTNSLNTTTLGRKTLGVRRSMNGWDSRKNK